MELMDKMMERMIKNMTIEEKENIMLKMMPMMMEDMDIKTMAPGMLAATGRLVTVTSVFDFIIKAKHDDELKDQLVEIKDSLPALAEKIKPMMSMMMSAMPNMMSGMMSFMGNKIMPSIMPMMHKMMPVMMKEMPEIMGKNEIMKELMPSMMMAVMPDCVETMVPLVEQDKQTEFSSRLNVAMDKAGIA